MGGSVKTWVLMVHLQESPRIMHLSELNLFLFIPQLILFYAFFYLDNV